MEHDITHDILEKIKDTKPKSRFNFLFKNYAFWIAAIVSVFVGAITVAVMLFVLLNQDWDLVHRVGGPLKALTCVLPYFWIVIFLLFIVIAYYEIRHVDGGYKFALYIIAGGYVGVTLLLGAGLYIVGVGNKVERGFVEHAGIYNRMVAPRYKIWHEPESGVLIGRIISVSSSTVELEDIEREIWIVDISAADERPVLLQTSMFVKTIGEMLENHMFKSSVIRIERLPMRPAMPMMVIPLEELKEMRLD